MYGVTDFNEAFDGQPGSAQCGDCGCTLPPSGPCDNSGCCGLAGGPLWPWGPPEQLRHMFECKA